MIHKFREDLLGGSSTDAPPYVIKASNLDKNFGLCYLLPVEGDNAPYKIDRSSEDGYKLQGTKTFDVCENGQPVKYRFFAERVATNP